MAHIFVVDDDEQLLRMVGLMLERGGHTATLVSNPIEALEMMREDVPDLAILDVMMPGMNGLELCRELRISKSTRNIPIVILTARGPIEDRREALEIGADTYLNKPVTSMELLENVNSLLAAPARTDKFEGEDSPAEDVLSADVEQSCKTVAIYGLTGGAGRTTLAVNLALHLQQNVDGNVCLVDFTSSGGQAAMQMRLQPRQSWANLLSIKEITADDVVDQIIEHNSGLHLLPAPLMPMSPDVLRSSSVEQIYSGLQSEYDFVIFDLPPNFSPVVQFVLGEVDTALHVFRPEVISVQTTVRFERLLQAKGPEISERLFVMNQPTSETQLGRATVERGINATVDFHIQFDKSQSKAMIQGNPVVLNGGGSAISKGVADIAERLLTAS